MSVLGLVSGMDTLVVGVEDDPGGGLRMYLGARYLHEYVVVDPADEERLTQDWAASFTGHLTAPAGCWNLPPHARYPGHEPGHHERNVRR